MISNWTVRKSLSFFGIFIVVFIIASLPLILKDGPHGLYLSNEGWKAFISYFNGISNGKSFQYQVL